MSEAGMNTPWVAAEAPTRAAVVRPVASLVTSLLAALAAGLVKLRADDCIRHRPQRLDEEGRQRDARRDCEYEDSRLTEARRRLTVRRLSAALCRKKSASHRDDHQHR